MHDHRSFSDPKEAEVICGRALLCFYLERR